MRVGISQNTHPAEGSLGNKATTPFEPHRPAFGYRKM